MISFALIASQINNPVLPNSIGDVSETPVFVGETLSKILAIAISLAGLVFFAMIVTGGIRWIASSGDKEKVGSAKKQITSAAIGMVLILLIFAVSALIKTLFGFSLLEFSLPKLQREDNSQPDESLPEDDFPDWYWELN